MLTSLTLTDWKSFGDSRNIVPFAPLTLLVGPNASGKSNVLDALRFLQGAAFDYPLADVLAGRTEGRREIWPGIRGNVVEAARAGRPGFSLSTGWCSGAEDVRYELAVASGDDVYVTGEQLAADGRRLYSVTSAIGTNVSLAFGTDEEGSVEGASGRRCLLGHVQRLNGGVPLGVADHAKTVADQLRDLVLLDIQPSRMRDYRPIQETQLLSSGENISPALRALSPELRRDVADWIEELCLSPFDDLEFEETQLREVMLYVTESTGRRISARSLSDGTLRFLGLVTALLTTPPGGIVVIEEPDMGMHPARVHLLAELLEQVTEAGRIQVIATTHSPVLLAHLSDSSLANVVALSRDPTSRTTVATRAGDLPDFGMLRDRAHTEELISTGWLERAV